ncbi:MAG: class I SAM-dependent methyltransferase [Legionellaceae bacterium]|nr:class I SAM-dependent methyltransferase [Legionellaceae bacterium]
MTVIYVNLDEQRRRYRALDDWFKTSQGYYFGQACRIQLLQYQSSLNSNILLQLGLCGESTGLSDYDKFKQAWFCTPCLNNYQTTLIASPNHLPLHRNSIDVVIAPMILEIFGPSNHPLDEIDRVLNPMGHVIFLGINPLSLWGLSLACGRLSTLGQAEMMPHSPLHLRRSFLNRGYQQICFDVFHYIPPFQQDKWIRKSFFLNNMGEIMPVFPAAAYCIILQKYQVSQPEMRLNTRRTSLCFPG